jgi:hypothetical protein
MNEIRRLSMSEARALAIEIAREFVQSSRWEGTLLGAEPNSRVSDRRGRTPVRWLATFTTVLNGVDFDGP